MTYAIRPYDAKQDDLGAITRLLHRAYAPLKEQGMWFVASEQSVEGTRSRLEYGFAFVAVDDATGAVLGTITLYAPSQTQHCEWYRDTLWHFGQFAVDPNQQGRGIGAALIAEVEQTARRKGAATMALDTAEPATGLVAFYYRLGYRHIGFTQWGSVNYRSVVMSKSLVAIPPPPSLEGAGTG